MAEGFADPSKAARMREVIQRLALDYMQQEMPPYRYGTVTQIEPDVARCMVQLPGDPDPIPVKMLGVQPVSVGQVVQVAGRKGDRFIAGVVGQSTSVDAPSTNLTAPTLGLNGILQGVNADWNAIGAATKYEIQFADDAAISVNVRTFQTISTSFALQNIAAGTEIFARVRALNNSGAGAWSTVQSATTEDFPPSGASDGNPPSASPDALLSSGLGYLLAEWLPVSNADLVTYEVHISTTTGFTPGAATLVGESTGTFFFINSEADGTPLEYDTTYFVRIIAKDADGAAAAGAQDSDQIDRVELGDVGNITSSDLTDGAPPSTSPDVGSVHNGVGFLYAQWSHISNADQVTYEVHISTVSGFTPDANSYVGETTSNWFFVRTQGAGTGFATLVYGTTYYIKLWAKDLDGYAANPGLQGSGATVQATGSDIADDSVTAAHMVTGTITASSGIIADAAIETAKIANLAVTTAKIADLAVDTAKINDLAVSTAKIADAAISTAKIGNAQITTALIGDAQITTAKIANLAVTNAKINDLSASKITAGTISTGTINVDAVLSLSGTGVFRSAGSGARIEITQSAQERIRFYGSGGLVGDLGVYSTGSLGTGVSFNSKVQFLNGLGTEENSLLDIRSYTMNSNLTVFRVYDGSYGERFRIEGLGHIVTVGDIYMTGSGQLRVPFGSSGAPGLSFQGDGNTGLYRNGEGSFRAVTNGNVKMTWGSSVTCHPDLYLGAAVIFPNSSIFQTNGVLGSQAITLAEGNARLLFSQRDGNTTSNGFITRRDSSASSGLKMMNTASDAGGIALDVRSGNDGGAHRIRALEFVVASDPELKANVTRWGGALTRLRAMKAYRYDIPHLDKGSQTRDLGFMADEAPAEIVRASTKPGERSINLYGLTTFTAVAVQELADMVDKLTDRVSQLEAT